MRLKHFLSVFLTLLTLSVGQMWGASTTGYFKKVTSATLSAGDTVIIVNTAESKALQNISTTSTKYGTLTDVSASSNVVTLSSANVEMFVLETGYNSTGFSFKGTSNISNNYLTWTSGNSLNKNSTKSANTSWTITWSSSTATIANNNTNTRLIRFNNDRFACYTTNTGTLAQVYKKAYKVTYDGNGSTGGSVPTDANYYYKNASVTAKSNSGTMVKSGHTFSGWNTKADGSGTAVAATGSATFTLTYNTTLYAQWEEDAPAYTITPAINDNSYGDVSLSGVVVTATPNACYEYASPAYTVSPAGKATVTQGTGANINKFTVSDVTADVTVTINLQEKAAGKTVNFDAGPGVPASASLTEDCADAGVTLPTVDLSGLCKGWGTFAGWATEAVNDSNTTSVTVYAAGSNYKPASNNMTLYAVYSKTKGTPESWDLVSAANDVTAGTYVITWENSYYLPSETAVGSNPAVGSGITQNNNKLTNAVTAAMQWTFTGDNTNGFTISHVSGNNTYKLSSTNAAQGISVTTGSTDRKWTASVHATYGMLLHGNDDGSRYLAVYNSGSWRYYAAGDSYTGKMRLYKKSGGSTTYYCSDPNCCLELGQINGSVSWSNAQATASWDDVTGMSNWKLYRSEHNADSWTEVTGLSASAGRYSNSTAISGLTAGQEYDFKVTGTYSGSTYCAQGYTFTFSSVVPKITAGTVSGASTYKVGYGPGTKQTFTVSAVGLDDDLTVSAPTNFLVCKTENGTYTSSVTLNHSEGTVASTTLYVQLAADLAVNDYNGNVSISGGGAASVNVVVTGIVSPDCSDPTIDSHPSGATYNMNATAAALSVTASHNGTGPAETYQWYSNTANNNTTGTPIAGETNSTYTPSTATAGTKYYYCIVYSGACSVTSNVAAVTVNTPIITIGGNKTSHDFESKAIGSENEVTISVSGTTLANGQNILLALSGEGASAYALSTSSLTASSGTVEATDVTITYTAVAGLSEATLTISSTGAVSKEIALSGTGKYQATFIANGNSESILVDGEGKLVLPASNPSSCNGTYSTFIGWYSTAAGSNGDPTTNIASCGTKAVTTHVLESNEIYYAVWGDGSLVADDVKQVTIDLTDNSKWSFPEGSNNKTVAEQSFSDGTYTIKVAGSANQGYYYNATDKYLLFGKNGAYIELPAFSFTTSKIVVVGKGGASGSVKENIYVGDEAVSTETTGSAGTNTYVIDNNHRAAGTIYSLKVSSDHNAQVTKIEVYSPGSGVATGFISSCCSTWDADPVVTYAAPSTWTVGDDAVSVSISGTTHGTASYESSNPSIISVAANGDITPVAIGSATITVTWTGGGYCDKAVTTAPVTVHGFVDVTFKKNGGSGTDDQTQSVEVGVSTALTSLATLGYGAPDCKEFGGWATTSDGEAVYDDEDPITASEATTLWAVWNTKTLSVAQGTGTAVGCEGDAFTYASSVACGGDVTITSSPDATHKAPFTITVLPDDAYEEIDGNVIKNVTKPITSISVSYTAKTSYAITWKVNDAAYAPHQEEEDGKVNGDALVYEGNTITILPTAPADNTLGCANKFMGWSTHDYKSVKKAASDYSDLFSDAEHAPEIEGATTFYAVFAKQTIEPEVEHSISFSRSGNTDTYTENYTFNATASADNGGFYKDKSSGEGDVKLYHTSTAFFTSAPASVELTAKIGGGSAKDPLGNNVRAQFVDKDGAAIGNIVIVTTKVEEQTGKNYVVNMDLTGLTSAYGVRLFHEKETSYNVRYYSFSLSYTTGGATTKDYVTQCAAVEAPTFSVNAGTYNEAQSVTLGCETDGADIYYTTNGSTPTSGSTAYSGAIAVNQNMTIKAIAIKGSDESDVAEAAYVLKVATPTISGNTSFVNSATVTIEATGADAIYYTDDDSDPASSGTKKTYSEPFAVSATTTIKAIAVKANWSNSEIASQTFTKVTPLDVATAITNISALANNGTIANQFVKGIISQIDQYNSGDNTITYWISDDGTTTSQMEVYHGSAGVANGGNAFSAADNLKVGEEVIVSGTLKKYVSGNKTTPEFVNPNEIVAYKTHSPIAWSAGACTAELNGEENEYPTLNNAAGLSISYESTTPTTATIDENGEVTPVDVGSTTIKATSAANSSYVATTVSYALTVLPTVTKVDLDIECYGATSGCPETTHLVKQTNLPDPLPTLAKAGKNFGGWYTDNTFETPAVAGASITENTTIYAQWLEPYPVADALTIISGLGANNANTISTEYYYVAGVVTDDAVSVSSNTATYKVKDSGESNELTVYKGKGLDNVNVTEASQIQEADEVVVYGLLQNYYGTAQIAQGNYIYSQVRPTYDVTGVTVASTANVRAGKTVTLTAEIAPANATNKNVTWSVKSGDTYAEVSAAGVVTGLAEGTAVIEVETEDGRFTAQCTVTVAAGLPSFTEDDHEWIKVSNASKLVAGRFYVIGESSKGVTATNDLSSGYLAKASTTITDGVIASGSLGTNTAIFELGGNSTDGWTLYELTDEENTGYLSGTNTSSLSWSASAATTSISFDESGNAILGNANGYRVLYNSSSPRFKGYDSNTSASMLLPQLYMWAELSHSVTFDANGGVAESVPSVERTDEGKITIPATEPTHSDVSKAFGGWYKSDAPGTLYTAGDEFETNVDVTLYAKWNTVPTYTVTYIPGGSGTVPAVASYRAGQKVQVEEASLSNPGYSFAGWTVKDADQNVLPLDEENKFDMPASNVTITAVWSRISTQKWNLVKHGESLEIDAEYVIAYNSTNTKKALSSINTSGSTHYGNSVEVTIDGEVLKGSELMKALTLKAGNGGSNYAFKNGDNYLTWSSGNSLDESETLNNASSWTIEIDENDVATITNVGTTSRMLQFNSSNSRFACYQASSKQQNARLYKKAASVVINNEQTVNAEDIPANADVTVKDGGTLNVNADKTIGDLTVEAGGEVELDANKLTVVGTFTIETTMASGKSGQLEGATVSNFAANGAAYIDITLGAGGTNQQWHAFTVPFPVDALSGIYDLENKPLTNEENYAIMDYHGDIRATGEYGWKKYRKTLVPGTFYLMTVDGLRTTYRFKKTADGALVAGNTKDLEEYPLNGGTEEHNDNGWNGVGNPTLRYGQVAYKVQVLNPTSYTYEPFEANETNFVVGTPFFIQANAAAAAADMTFGAASGEANYAPARTPAKGIESVKVTFGNEEYKDRLYISASEDALNRYETGKDLAKMTMTSTPKVAQIFGKAYNSKLCMVYAPMVNDQAVYDLTLYAPANGEYTIAAPNVENADLYLTYEGNIIWNLSMSAYPMDLKKGNTEGYGLLLQAKAPMSPTGIENTDALNGANSVQKIILDEKVFILRGGKMYDVTGKAVK